MKYPSIFFKKLIKWIFVCHCRLDGLNCDSKFNVSRLRYATLTGYFQMETDWAGPSSMWAHQTNKQSNKQTQKTRKKKEKRSHRNSSSWKCGIRICDIEIEFNKGHVPRRQGQLTRAIAHVTITLPPTWPAGRSLPPCLPLLPASLPPPGQLGRLCGFQSVVVVVAVAVVVFLRSLRNSSNGRRGNSISGVATWFALVESFQLGPKEK